MEPPVRPDVSDFELTTRLLDPGDGAPGICQDVLSPAWCVSATRGCGSRSGEVFLSAKGAFGDGGTCRRRKRRPAVDGVGHGGHSSPSTQKETRPHPNLAGCPPPAGAVGLSSRLRSNAGALWVTAPTDIASTPVPATAVTVSSVMDPDASSRGPSDPRRVTMCRMSSKGMLSRAAAAASAAAYSHRSHPSAPELTAPALSLRPNVADSHA